MTISILVGQGCSVLHLAANSPLPGPPQASTLGAGEAGKYNAPGLPDIIGKYGQVFARPAVAEGPFAGSDIIAENVQGGTDSAIDYLVTVGFRASAANPTYGALPQSCRQASTSL